MSKLNKTAPAELRNHSEVDELIADVLARMDRNEHVDISRLITAHPVHAEELRRFFSFSQDLSEMMRSDSSQTARTSIYDQAQRSTTSIDSQTVAMLSSQSGPASPDPRKIGKYEILELLGAGSFGRVY